MLKSNHAKQVIFLSEQQDISTEGKKDLSKEWMYQSQNAHAVYIYSLFRIL